MNLTESPTEISVQPTLEEYLQEHAPMSENPVPTAPPTPPVVPTPEIKLAGSNAELISKLEAEKSALALTLARVQADQEAASRELAKLNEASRAAEDARLESEKKYQELWQRERAEKEALLSKQTEFSKRQALANEFAKHNALDVELLTDAAMAKSGDKLIVQDGQVLGVEGLVSDFKAAKANLFKSEPNPIPGAVNNPLVPGVKPTGNPGTMPPADSSATPFNAMNAKKEDLDKAWDDELAKLKSDGRRSL